MGCDYRTHVMIKKFVIKLSKKEIMDLQLYRLRELFFGNYLFIYDSKYIKENKSNKMTKVLKKVNKNYNMEEDY